MKDKKLIAGLVAMASSASMCTSMPNQRWNSKCCFQKAKARMSKQKKNKLKQQKASRKKNRK